ncbi:MAG TPA: hypothetical protein VLJ59_12975 [Mycobacteriales bacterium]|nr:hypothetical protein [Mycobacteriales bacterium]
MTKSRIHAVAGTFALILISLFFLSSIVVEVAGSERAVVAVKTAILYALVLLVPSMAITGGSGRALAGKRGGGRIGRKKRRMAVVALIGLGVLIPCAVTLHRLAVADHFGATFYAIQAIELLGGAVNITLLGLNVRDGRALAGRSRRSTQAPETAPRRPAEVSPSN